MLPLAGLRVVDLADEKGELCGRALADLGAEVIRVEPPGGAASRRLPPFVADGTLATDGTATDGPTSLYFAMRNAGKRSVTLDIGEQAGRQRLQGLLAEAEILIESTQPGTLERLGLAPALLLEQHPGLVITSISGGATPFM